MRSAKPVLPFVYEWPTYGDARANIIHAQCDCGHTFLFRSHLLVYHPEIVMCQNEMPKIYYIKSGKSRRIASHRSLHIQQNEISVPIESLGVCECELCTG